MRSQAGATTPPGRRSRTPRPQMRFGLADEVFEFGGVLPLLRSGAVRREVDGNVRTRTRGDESLQFFLDQECHYATPLDPVALTMWSCS